MSIYMRSKWSRRSGSSLIETTAGLLVLVPLVLFLVDLVTVILVQNANDALAKHAARVAAETPDPNPSDAKQYKAAQTAAQTAAQNVVNAFQTSRLASNPTLVTKAFAYTDNRIAGGVSQVYVETQVTCTLPIPVPLVGTSKIVFSAEATEPIVAVLPP